MTKHTAKKVVDLMYDIGRKLDLSVETMKRDAAADVFSRYTETISNLLSEVNDKILTPIYTEHPDLIPPDSGASCTPSPIRMTKATAEAVSAVMVSVGGELSDSVALVRRTETDENIAFYQDFVGRVMFDMLTEVMNPLYAQHPEIKPPELR